MLSEGLHSVSGQVKVEAVGTDLRSGYLKLTGGAEETLDLIVSSFRH